MKPGRRARPRESAEAALAKEGLSKSARGASLSTVYNWVRKGRLLAWKGPDQGLRIPAGQILGPRKVVPALAEIVDIIGDAELAWDFLTEEWPLADDAAYPLEKLKSGQVEEVLDTAPAFGMTFT